MLGRGYGAPPQTPPIGTPVLRASLGASGRAIVPANVCYSR